MENAAETLAREFKAHHDEVKEALEKAGLDSKKISARLLELEQKSVRRSGGPAPAETWGSQVVNSDGLKGVSQNFRGRARIEVKATITSATTNADGSAGDLLVPDRQGGIIGLARRKLRMRDLFAPGKTTGNSVEWPKLTSSTNNAATVAEAASKPQSDLIFDLVQWPVRTIAHWMIASKQILDDSPQLQSVIDAELTYGVKDVEDAQLLNGGGTGSDLTGVYTNATAFVSPFDVESINMIDVVLQAMAQVEALKYEADGIVLNPLDWRTIQATKDTTGRYLGGGPFGDLPQKLWQMPIVTTTAMTQDKFLVGPFRQGGQIFDRQEAIVEISTEDSDNFRKNLVTLRGEERLAFVIKYPDAFVKGDFSDAMSL